MIEQSLSPDLRCLNIYQMGNVVHGSTSQAAIAFVSHTGHLKVPTALHEILSMNRETLDYSCFKEFQTSLTPYLRCLK